MAMGGMFLTKKQLYRHIQKIWHTAAEIGVYCSSVVRIISDDIHLMCVKEIVCYSEWVVTWQHISILSAIKGRHEYNPVW